jgi:hypothetical protein
MDSVLALAYSDVRLQVDGLEGRFEGRENAASNRVSFDGLRRSRRYSKAQKK